MQIYKVLKSKQSLGRQLLCHITALPQLGYKSENRVWLFGLFDEIQKSTIIFTPCSKSHICSKIFIESPLAYGECDQRTHRIVIPILSAALTNSQVCLRGGNV